jgi:hypothetical protein
MNVKRLGWSLTGLGALAAAFIACSSNPAAPSEAAAQARWRDTIVRSPPSKAGCFHVSYPNTTWETVDCGPAPTRLYRPRHGAIPRETVGDDTDYVAQSSGTISQSVGSFPSATGTAGVTSYSLQLNSNDMSGSAACGSVSGCKSWQQFVYAAGEQIAFIQSWLIGIGTCPTGGSWIVNGNDCYMNSTTVSVPLIASDQLTQVQMSGTAAAGNDSMVFTNGGDAYSASTPDSTTNLSTGWSAAEFNIFGDGNSSAVTFQPGASISVNVSITGGSPTCQSGAGTTGETNNLTLGSCTVSGGAIQFTETLAGNDGGSEGGKDGGKDSGDSGKDSGDSGKDSASDGGEGGSEAGDDGGDEGGSEAGDDGGSEAGDDGGGDDGGGGGEGGTTCDNSETNAPTP